MKKFFALMLAVVLVSVCFTALAANSKTTNDVAKTQIVNDETLVIKIVDPSEAAAAFFAKMTDGDTETLPEGAKAEELVELLAVSVTGAKEGIGDQVANLVTTTVYEAEQKVHAYVGILKDEKAEWQELNSVSVVEDGSLDLALSEKLLLTMQNSADALLAIFVEAAE